MSDSGELETALRRAPKAASVVNRWWESEQAAAPPPPPPSVSAPLLETILWDEPAPVPAWGRGALQEELDAAREEIAALHLMLEELPEIFERKFRQRVQGLIEDQRRLQADNQILRDRLYALMPTRSAVALAPGSQADRPGLRRSLRGALSGLPGWRSRAVNPLPQPYRLNPADDDGQTTAA